MATVGIVFGKIGMKTHDQDTNVMGGSSSDVTACTAITSSGSSQQSSASNPYDDGSIVEVTSEGGAVWMKVGSNPTASAGNDFLIPTGGSKAVMCRKGDKVAVIDA